MSSVQECALGLLKCDVLLEMFLVYLCNLDIMRLPVLRCFALLFWHKERKPPMSESEQSAIATEIKKPFRRLLAEKWFLTTSLPTQRIVMSGYSKPDHCFTFVIGWLWIVSGIIVGSLISLPLIDALNIHTTSLELFRSIGITITWETLVSIGIALLVGFIVQLIGWLFLISITSDKSARELVSLGAGEESIGLRIIITLIIIPDLSLGIMSFSVGFHTLMIWAMVSGAVGFIIVVVGGLVSFLFRKNDGVYNDAYVYAIALPL
jgi:hypothetical protein